MIDVRVFELKKCAMLYVVSTPEVIGDLRAFTESHLARGDLSADMLYNRILFHDAFCCVVPETLSGRLSVRSFTRELKKKCRLINLDAYYEAFVFANPEEAAATIPFPIESLIDIAEESDWGIVIEVDRKDIVERLRKVKRDRECGQKVKED